MNQLRWQRILASLLFVGVLLSLPLGASAQAAQPSQPSPAATPALPLKTRLQARLDELHKNGEFPGAVMGYVLPDGASGSVAAGWADPDAKTAMRPDDRMFSGSIGKTYVSAVVMQLIGEGKLSLDDPLAKWLGQEPWFERVPNAPTLTLRMLLNHTSGVPEHVQRKEFIAAVMASPDKVWTPAEMLSYIFDQPALGGPGEKFSYADTNYILVGMIIEKCTGNKFYDELQRRILNPLKLTKTEPSTRRDLARLVPGQSPTGKAVLGTPEKVFADGRYFVNPQFEWTGGGLISDAEDLARWARAAYDGRAFRREMLELMIVGNQMGGPNSPVYGLGVMVHQTSAGRALGHSGWMPGYLSEMLYFPDHKLAVAVQFNTDRGRALRMSTTAFATRMAEVILADLAPAAPPQ